MKDELSDLEKEKKKDKSPAKIAALKEKVTKLELQIKMKEGPGGL
jgi:hypothetical protein